MDSACEPGSVLRRGAALAGTHVEICAVNKVKTHVVTLLRHLLPKRIRDSLLHLSFHIAPDEFKKFAHLYSFAPDMELGLEAFKRLGFAPGAILDVGAFEGDWARMARRLWPQSRLILIEPNRAKKPLLEAISVELGAELHCELLGATDGQDVEFHLMGSGSSVMGERSPLPRTTEHRQLRRLDSLLNGIPPPALLKIDAQGYELEILKGATGLMQSIDAVLLEVALIEINEGAPLLYDVLVFMQERGFVAYDILEIHRRPLDRALNQVDILFLKQNSLLISDKRHFAPALERREA